MDFPMASSQPDIRKEALVALTAQFIKQGHPPSYAQHMATASIFQADLELRNAQFSRLLAWLKESHADIYPKALEIAEDVRQEFEKRVTGEF
ncbi:MULTISPECIES: hypothetical protein [Cyanophyceae]|uniref:hypothetical protein n=1 Tax=Cyanophyceae TaxID=3028117 RepID=UPI001685C598|nr:MULTISPECIES: hypothetical protein [Cyanophyceae]MBD1914824.1 hypothetical protein [Phormidium sp. FACHB-77]MBD2029942.1 hypothetical protein [Phormidium sp. FACHB-322]MBD2049252.1 hypothetical protein [Leptolyngbya sp. FACHB-60]